MSFTSTLTANGESGEVRCTGTLYQMQGEGAFGGGTLTPERKSYDGTWVTLGDTALTADGYVNIEVPQGAEIRGRLSGATSPSLIVHFSKIK